MLRRVQNCSAFIPIRGSVQGFAVRWIRATLLRLSGLLMFSSLRCPLAATLFLFVSLQLTVGDETKPPTGTPDLAAANQLYRAGKFVEAEASYRSLVSTDPKLVPAQVGLVRSMLREQKFDEAFDTVNSALGVRPDSAALLAAKGDVQFRRAEMSDAERSYLAAKKLDRNEVHAYLGLARVYSAYSLYRTAYGELQIAHDLAPDNIDVRRAWLNTLPRKEKLAALEAYLAEPHPDDEEETTRMSQYLDFLKATANKPAHYCRLISKVEQTETKLEKVDALEFTGGWRSRRYSTSHGVGLAVKLNNQNVKLLLDTGAGGIVVSQRVAEKSGLNRLSAMRVGGIGDQGSRSGYSAVADQIQIGELEFRDCIVTVTDQRSVIGGDGLIGADVFGSYLIDIDLPGMQLKLSPLPNRPEDTVTPTSLNSEGEDQANVEQREGRENNTVAEVPQSSARTSQIARGLPKDRYIAPEMADWTKVFRFGHNMLVPTNVNDSKAMLFGLDTGAFTNTLSLRAGRQVGKVNSDYSMGVRGLSGNVKNVYITKVALRFGRLQLPNLDIVTFDLSNPSKQMGTELSGFLGFQMLQLLELKLDYRDGLVDFAYDSKRAAHAK